MPGQMLTSGGDLAVLQMNVTVLAGEFYSHADHFGQTWTSYVSVLAEQGNCVCPSITITISSVPSLSVVTDYLKTSSMTRSKSYLKTVFNQTSDWLTFDFTSENNQILFFIYEIGDVCGLIYFSPCQSQNLSCVSFEVHIDIQKFKRKKKKTAVETFFHVWFQRRNSTCTAVSHQRATDIGWC